MRRSSASEAGRWRVPTPTCGSTPPTSRPSGRTGGLGGGGHSRRGERTERRAGGFRVGCGPERRRSFVELSCARWSRLDSERDFYRYADAKLRDAFPTLPDRSQFNRLVRSHANLIEAFDLHLV